MKQTSEYHRAWRMKNRSKDRAYSAKYRAKNPEKERARHALRCAKEKAEELQSWVALGSLGAPAHTEN